MVIAVNTRYFIKACQQDYATFIYACFSRLANQYPQHTFIYFSDSALDPSFEFTKNSIPLVIMPEMNTGLLSGVWYIIKVARLLKRYKVNVFLNADGFYPVFTKVPQCFVLFDPVSLSNKVFVKKTHLFMYSRHMAYFLKRVKVIVTDSQFSKNYIIQKYKTSEQKPGIIYTAVSDFSAPAGWEAKEEIKAQYANGNEYFIVEGDTLQKDKVLNLLKAFSQFKKWQKSGMQLLIIQKKALNRDLTESLRLFKYKKDVTLLNCLPYADRAKVIAAAYAMVYLPLFESFCLPPLEAMMCKIPVITADIGSIAEICSDAVLYADFNNPDSIAEKLMLIFKDEKLRQELIEKGNQQVQSYNWAKTTSLLWHNILKASA